MYHIFNILQHPIALRNLGFRGNKKCDWVTLAQTLAPLSIIVRFLCPRVSSVTCVKEPRPERHAVISPRGGMWFCQGYQVMLNAEMAQIYKII